MHQFFEPRSVVLIGVSRQSGPGAYNNLEMMIRYGYEGRIYVVHPTIEEILGHRTWRRVADIPEVPELAVISVGRDRVQSVFAECIERGIKNVLIISQGFSDADERGKELQEDLVQLAKSRGVRVVGPNTMGILNPIAGFSTAFVDIRRDPAPPPLSIIVQTGTLQVGYESFTGRVGKAIDIGNTSDVDFVDVLEYLEDDAQTEIIAIHMEGLKRGREFLRTASRVARKKPIIVLKTGRSTAGAKAALSHSGSLAGEDSVIDAAFVKAGLIRVRNMVELHAASNAFLHYSYMSGPRVAVVTATGACGIMTADACEDYGLELAPFPEQIRDELENPYIAWHKLHNPVDIWPLGMVGNSFTDVFIKAVTALLKDERVDAVFGIAPAVFSPLHEDIDMAAAVRAANQHNPSRKPIALWLYGGGQDTLYRELEDEGGVACFHSIDEAMMGLAAVWRYHRHRLKGNEDRILSPMPSVDPPTVSLPSKGLLLGEPAFSLLRNYGIPLVPGELTRDVKTAAAFALGVGYPVVLKIVSPEWLHKSDWGGIRLNIGSEAELYTAYDALMALFSERTPDARLDGILVQKQIQGTELLFGIKRDPQFGPVLVAGMGGIYTEVFKDIARMVAPVTAEDVWEMLRSLQIFPILKGARGQKGVHLDALVEVALALSTMATDYPNISELDLNPVLANSDGCWCVDVRVVLGDMSGHEAETQNGTQPRDAHA